MTFTTGLLALATVWILAGVFIVGLCHAASRHRPSEVLIPEVARRPRRRPSDRG